MFVPQGSAGSANFILFAFSANSFLRKIQFLWTPAFLEVCAWWCSSGSELAHLYLCILYLYLCICIFICPPPSPHPHLVFAWWCGAGPELDHLYQFVSDYSHQVIVQLTHQKYIWQLRQIHLTINRNTFDNYDKYIWQFGQIALTICTTLSLIIATKSLCRSSSSATNKRQSKTDCLALITSTREG